MSLLSLGDTCGPGAKVAGACPAGACCSKTTNTCLVGALDTCTPNDPSNGPPSVQLCAALVCAVSTSNACGPAVNAFCPWSRTVDQCCLKDKDSLTTQSQKGTCAPCSGTSTGGIAMDRLLWRYDGKSGWY